MEPSIQGVESQNIVMKSSFKDRIRSHHLKRPVLMVFLAALLIVSITAASVAAFIALTNDRAVFKSRITAENPTRQHILRVEGDGELIATLRDTTDIDSNEVRYNLSLLNSEGELVQRKIANTAGSNIKIVENVLAGDYTFIVTSEDVLTQDGASYTLRIDYPNDVADFDDKTSPTVSISQPELGSDVMGIFTVSGSADDETELSEVSVRIGETGSWIVAEGTTSWSVEVDSNKFESEQYIIEVQAIDESGNNTIERTLVNFTNPSPDPTPEPHPNPTPTPNPTPNPNPTPTPNPTPNPGSETSFFDDFTLPDWRDRYDFDIYHRDDTIVSQTSWLGDHNRVSGGSDPDNCTVPEDKRSINRGSRAAFNNDWIYRCAPGDNPAAAHLMTSIGDTSGYSIGLFTPKQTFRGITEVSWEQNVTDLGDRQWTEVAVIPANQFVIGSDNYPCLTSFPCNSATYQNTGAVGVRYIGSNGGSPWFITPEFPGAESWDRYDDSSPRRTCLENPGYCFNWNLGEGDPALKSIRTRRTFVMKDNQNGTITLSIEKANGSFENLNFDGSFAEGDVRVLFKDHNYTPAKSNPGITFTWHWDNISVR